MLHIDTPLHGAVINRHWGTQTADALTIEVTGSCPVYGDVTVNSVPAKCALGRFTCDVPVTCAEQAITAVYDGTFGHHEHSVRVFWDRHSFPRYGFSIDDNSFWLRDVARNGYASLFDCFYLAMLRDMNREFGAKFALNIYYTTEDGFTLPQFPDCYRAEFADNADWLVLAFHAYANEPARPYQYSSAEQVVRDIEMVEEQICRFAGPQSLAPQTNGHWAMYIPEAFPALYDLGVRALSADCWKAPWGWDINYWLDPIRTQWIVDHGAIMDCDSGICFPHTDIIVNSTPPEQVASVLGPYRRNPHHADFMNIITHEQYFWPFYSNYVPDHRERCSATLRWLADNGYEPVFMHEGFLGAPWPA